MTRFGPDVIALFRKLLSGYRLYFSDDLLNSEGRKVFGEAARMLVYEHPELKPAVVRVRRNPTLDNVLRLARRVLGSEVDELVSASIEGPYRWRL